MPVKPLVTPEEWVSRTWLRFGRRRASTRKCDEAYAAYYRDQSEKNRVALREALEAYLVEKGGHWEKVHRNVDSGGLMKEIYELTASPGIQKLTVSQSDRQLLDARVPETRHGVLYLWANTSVETQWGAILLEGGLSVASAGLSMASDLQDFDPGDSRAYGYAAGAGTATLGGLGTGIARGNRTADAVPPPVAGRPRSGANSPPPPPPPPPGLERKNAVRSLNVHEVESTARNITRAKQILGDFFHKIWEAIQDAVRWLWNKLVTNLGIVISTASAIIEKIVLLVVEEVAKAAAPFVGAGIDLARGVFQTISGIKNRLEAYLSRSKFVVRPGHPAEIANAIERQMNWAIGKGLYSTIKGGAKLGFTFLTAGASSIIDAIAAGIEFATRLIMRLVEGRGIKQFIEQVKEACKTKKGQDPMRPAIAYDTEGFNALFSAGCDSSACIPMMTLNSGIAGDQMMFMKMFDDTESTSMVKQKSFDAATDYFSQLKQYGRDYVVGTGFRFTSPKKDVQGYLNHAVTHHTPGNVSALDAALTFVS